jgi:hypothetical protein
LGAGQLMTIPRCDEGNLTEYKSPRPDFGQNFQVTLMFLDGASGSIQAVLESHRVSQYPSKSISLVDSSYCGHLIRSHSRLQEQHRSRESWKILSPN